MEDLEFEEKVLPTPPQVECDLSGCVLGSFNIRGRCSLPPGPGPKSEGESELMTRLMAPAAQSTQASQPGCSGRALSRA